MSDGPVVPRPEDIAWAKAQKPMPDEVAAKVRRVLAAERQRRQREQQHSEQPDAA